MGKGTKAAIFIIGQIITALLIAGTAKADIGPAQIYAEGGVLKPAADTNISMESEKVVLTYGQPQQSQGQVEVMAMPAHVVAQFKMNNPSTDAQKIKLYFPADDSQYVGGWDEEQGKDITNFSVNGTKLDSGTVDVGIDKDTFGYNPKYDLTIKAYQWDQDFAPGETTITVEYDAMSAQNINYYDLTYVLGTGRNWAGPIKQGEVDFVFPDKVQTYAVTSKPPLLRSNKLSYTIEDKTIKVAFTNYEPANGDVISLGIAAPSVVSEIESAKQLSPQTLSSTIRIASLFRGLSVGGHCVFCIDPAGEISQKYYAAALSAAESKDEVNQVMDSLAFGDNSSEYRSMDKLYSWFEYFTANRICDDEDANCNSEEYIFANATPFGMAGSTATSNNADLLALYACRLRPYDMAKSIIVEDYANMRLEDCPTKSLQTDQESMTAATDADCGISQCSTTQAINWPLLAGIVAASWAVLGVIVAIVTLIVRHFRRRKGADLKKIRNTNTKKDEE